MSVNKFNPEGYHDPTAYEALVKIEKEERRHPYRPVIYICSPFSGNTERNTQNARRYCRFAVDKGYIPIAPHLLFPQFLDETNPDERSLAIFMDIALLGKCAELWVFGGNITKGMRIEMEKARCKRQPTRYFTEACEEVSK